MKMFRSSLWMPATGCLFILIGLAIIIWDPVMMYARYDLRVENGTKMYNMLENPTIHMYVKSYLFNVTNADRFLSGEDHKLKVEEVGPFTYLEMRKNANMSVEDGSLRYIPKRDVKFIPEMSIGDPKDYTLVVPNVPLLAGLSLIAGKVPLMNWALSPLTSSLNTKVVMEVNAYDYLWGYRDPIITTLNTFFNFWIDFDKFGLLDRMYDDKDVWVEMELQNQSSQYSIRSWDGIGGLKMWGYHDLNSSTPCNRLKGAYEGLLYTPNLNKEDIIYIYRKQICRTMGIKFHSEYTHELGMKVWEYRPVPGVFDPSPENSCMCQNKCLPKGLSDLTPCYYNLPVAMSWPHFSETDPSLYERIEGMRPDPERYMTKIIVEPTLGMPLHLTSATQSNVVVDDVSYNQLAKRFSNMVIPIIWMSAEMQDLDEQSKFNLKLLFVYAAKGSQALAVFLIVAGVFMVAYSRSRAYFSKWRREMVLETSPLEASHITNEKSKLNL